GRRARLAQFQAEARRKIEWFRGREIKIDNGEMFTIFDGPARALRCACRLTETAHRHGFTVRAGLHTGECDVRKEGVSGVAVSVAAHVMERARPGEVLSSSTVKDLVAGSGIQFSDCGDQTIEGLPGKLGLCRVEQGTCT
ncbi:MAG: hydrolase, partial [Pyrinomonadaceae bacterium]|nr:hydrolase [Pyrinomonadaceae bacterium]